MEVLMSRVFWSILMHIGYALIFFYLWVLLILYTDYVLLKRQRKNVQHACEMDPELQDLNNPRVPLKTIREKKSDLLAM